MNPVLGEANVPADAAAFMNSTGGWANDGTRSITGLDNVDLWVGGLAEKTNPFGGLLGTTFNYVFENQMTDLQNGDRLYYLARTPGMNLRTQLEGNSFAELMMRNTTAHTLKADAFATADCKFELKNLAGTPAGFTALRQHGRRRPGLGVRRERPPHPAARRHHPVPGRQQRGPGRDQRPERLQRHRRGRPHPRRQRQRHLLGRPGQRPHRGRRRSRRRARWRGQRHHHRPRR